MFQFCKNPEDNKLNDYSRGYYIIMPLKVQYVD